MTDRRVLRQSFVTGIGARLRVFRGRWIACALIAAAVTASAQENLDEKGIVGTWVGTLHAAGRSPASVEVDFEPDGAFAGGSNAAQADEVFYAGRWKVDGSTIRVDFTAEGSEEESEVSWTLRQDGDELRGRALRQLGMLRYDVRLRRAAAQNQ